MSKNPRRQYSYSTAQSAETTDYVPGRTRNAAREAMFKGHEGIVIPFQQKVGAAAMATTFETIVDHSYSPDTEQMAGLFAIASFGTAFHAFAQRPQHRVIRRHGQLPDMLDRDTLEPIGVAGLNARAQAGLFTADVLATQIEEMARNDADPKRIEALNYKLGRSALSNALTLAAIHRRVANMSGNEYEMQELARDAAEASSQDAIDLTAKLGVRPSIAQLADPSSPWMRYQYDNQEVISQQNYDILTEQVRRFADEFTVTS